MKNLAKYGWLVAVALVAMVGCGPVEQPEDGPEPWESVPTYHDKVDDLETKAMMNRLLPGSVYEKAYTVTVG